MRVRILGTLLGHFRKDGAGQTGYSVYDENGIAPTILSHGGGHGIMIVERKLGNLYGYDGGNFGGNVYDKNGLCPALLTMQGGGKQPMVIDDCWICAMRGRMHDGKWTQRLEVGEEDVSNSLTTVQKDNLLLERNMAEEKRNGFFEAAEETAKEGNARPGDIIDAFNRTVNRSGISPTVTTRPEGKKTAILPVTENYRIRKLTEHECWRLMGYAEEDFGKAAEVNSKSQLYKQAGNAIVKQVLMAIFSQMNIKGVKPWNEMSDDERRTLVRKGGCLC